MTLPLNPASRVYPDWPRDVIIIPEEYETMGLRDVSPTWKHVKTYATEAGLMKRIEEDKQLYPEYDDRFIVVRTPEGRWTAIVQLDRSVGGFIGRYEFLKV